MRPISLALFFVVFSISQALSAEPVARAPYRIDYAGWFIVSANVNGEGPYDFIIDSGTTRTLVFDNLATSANFEETGGEQQHVMSVGEAGFFPPYRIGEIAIGEARLTNLDSVILPAWMVDDRSPYGIIGSDFLAQFYVVFDAIRREIVFYDRSETGIAPPDWAEVPLKRETFDLESGVLFTLEGVIERRKIEFLFDTGAVGTIINPPALGKIAKRRRSKGFFDPADQLTGKIIDALEEEHKIYGLRIRRFKSGENIWKSKVFIVFNAPIFETLNRKDTPFGLFGADMLRDRSFALDLSRNLLLVGPVLEQAS